MYPHTTRALAAATLALAMGACADAPTTPAARAIPADQSARIVSPSGATLIPNTVKYRDSGGKPATGRSGSAALQAFALLGGDGVTKLEFRPVPAGPSEPSTEGSMTRAQVRALDVDSTMMFQYNVNHLDASLHQAEFGSLVRGQYVQVQANITGIDPHRTNVVTVTERVKLRPDLAVQLEMAPEVPQDLSVPVIATVAELNGDVGAHADCTLLVDGLAVDQAVGIWVDAGDAVNCAFTHTFASGTHSVQVEVTGVAPGDWDESNNISESVAVQAVSRQTEFYYGAFASAQDVRTLSLNESRWYNPTTQTRGEGRDEQRGSDVLEYASITAWMPRALSGEISVDALQTTGGRVVHTAGWTGFGSGCSWRLDGTASFYFCTQDDPYWGQETWFRYDHNARAVTYHSSSYYREWDEGTGEELYYYHVSFGEGVDDGVVGFGDDYAFHVRVINGDVVLTADTEFPLQATVYAVGDSRCSTYTEPWEGFTSEWCTSWEFRNEERRGQDSKVDW